jgi:hypothetical protein
LLHSSFWGDFYSNFQEKSDHEANMVLWIKNVEALNTKIKELMDPVDLMFYENRLHQQIRAFYFR